MSPKPASPQPTECCPVPSPSENLAVLSPERARELEALFKTLGNRTRLRMIHSLIRRGPLCVSDIARAVRRKPQAVSNQLQKLSERGIVASERNGNNIHYRIVDPCVFGLFDQGICLLEDSKERQKWLSKILSTPPMTAEPGLLPARKPSRKASAG